MSKLVIAEKPSVAQLLAKVIGQLINSQNLKKDIIGKFID